MRYGTKRIYTPDTCALGLSGHISYILPEEFSMVNPGEQNCHCLKSAISMYDLHAQLVLNHFFGKHAISN